MGMKNVHAVVKEKNCEGCHLRHGIVPKLLLKKDGNEVCFPCHSKEKIGLNKSNVHTVLKRGKCVTCHDPHASSAAHLLKKEGNEACYECHKKAGYEKKVIHKVKRDALPAMQSTAPMKKTCWSKQQRRFVLAAMTAARHLSRNRTAVTRWKRPRAPAAIILIHHSNLSF
jgi:predicted CXXCH cytochrome family protein